MSSAQPCGPIESEEVAMTIGGAQVREVDALGRR